MVLPIHGEVAPKAPEGLKQYPHDVRLADPEAEPLIEPVRGLPRRAAARLQLGNLRALLAPDLERRLDERLTHAPAARRIVDHDLVQPRLDPERRGVDDHGRRAHDLLAVSG